jgi:ABC-type sugar transport system permease subunit
VQRKERPRLLKKHQSIWQSEKARKKHPVPACQSGGGAIIHRSRYAWIWFMLPSVAGVVIFVLLPFLDVVRRSFVTAVTQEWIGFRNYKIIFSNQAFGLAVKNTVRFTLVCLPLLIGIGLFLSVQLSRLKEMQLIKSLFLFPMAMPAATVVLIWKMMFSRQGFLNGWLMGAGFPGDGALPDYMGTSAAFWVLVFSYIWKNLGYTMVLWLAGIFSVSTDLTEAARVDGATDRQCFWRVVFPNLKGSLYTITVLSFLNSFKVFREAYLVAGSYPHESMYLLQHLFNNWFVNLELDKMAAAAVCTGTVLFGVILLLQRLWDQEEDV